MKVAVAGAGTMGAGIAQACAVAGHEVLLQDVSEDARTRGMDAIKTSLSRVVKKGGMSEDERAAALARITLIGDLHWARTELFVKAVWQMIHEGGER